jgi:DDE superfamily endonuclease
VRGRCYAPRGRTPTVYPSHKRAGVGLISAISNKGVLRWMVPARAISATVLIIFLARLIRDVAQKLFLILDRLPVHRCPTVQAWVAERRDRIEVF